MSINKKNTVTQFYRQDILDESKFIADPTHLKKKLDGASSIHLARHVQGRTALEELCKAVPSGTHRGEGF